MCGDSRRPNQGVFAVTLEELTAPGRGVGVNDQTLKVRPRSLSKRKFLKPSRDASPQLSI